MSECGAVNPDGGGQICIVQQPGHGSHMDGQGGCWPNVQRITEVREQAESRTRRRSKSPLKRIVDDARKGKRVILEGDSGPGLDPEITGVWLQDEWQTYAGRIVERFLQSRETEFTTAEDVWPLLDKPEEMRAMSVLVQALLKAHHIEEVAAKRLRGTYRTKDGFEFAENKLVPIYRSLIYSGLTDVARNTGQMINPSATMSSTPPERVSGGG